MVEQAAAALVRSVEHDTEKAVFGQHRDQLGIRFLVGEQDGDQPRAGRQWRQRAGAGRPVPAGEEADLDHVDAGGRRLCGPRAQDLRLHRQIAEHSAHRPAAGDRRHRGTHDPGWHGAERAGGGVLEVDDVGTAGERHLGFGRAGHAGQHLGHCVVAPVASARKRVGPRKFGAFAVAKPSAKVIVAPKSALVRPT